MSLSLPIERTPVHSRTVSYHAFHRTDRLWDIEARVTDTKSYLFTSAGLDPVSPAVPIHDMVIRATVDDALTIRAIEASMLSRPHGECTQATAPMQKLVGCTMGPGWRSILEKHLGGVQGCTHLRELMFNMATAAFQAIPSYREFLARQAGQTLAEPSRPPFQLGGCMSWDSNGPLTKKHFPQFIGWQPVRTPK